MAILPVPDLIRRHYFTQHVVLLISVAAVYAAELRTANSLACLFRCWQISSYAGRAAPLVTAGIGADLQLLQQSCLL